MDKREYGSYEEVHAMLVEAMQEACTKDESGNYQTPYIDTDFLYENHKPISRKKRFTSSFAKVAAIIIIALLSVNTVILVTDSNESYGDGGLLHRIFEGARGIFTDEDPSGFVEFDETGDVFITNNFEDIEDAKKFWPGLYVPGYIPEGYVLEELKICKDVSGVYFAEYSYSFDTNPLKINMIYLADSNKVCSSSRGECYEFEDRIIYLYKDSIDEYNIADIYIEDYYINICSYCPKEKILSIAKHVNK